MARTSKAVETGRNGVIQTMSAPVEVDIELEGIGTRSGSADAIWQQVDISATDKAVVFAGLLAVAEKVAAGNLTKEGKPRHTPLAQMIELFNDGSKAFAQGETRAELSKIGIWLRSVKKTLKHMAVSMEMSKEEAGAFYLGLPKIREKLLAAGVTLAEKEGEKKEGETEVETEAA